MVNKKGMFFWIELLFLVALFVIIFVSFPRSSDNFLATKDAKDLQSLGFSAVEALDSSGVLSNFTNSTDFEKSNFTALSVYIRKSFPSTIELNIEYFNGTDCFSESGSLLAGCGNFTKSANTVVSEYTMARMPKPVTLQLYLRRIF